ncbi:MAG: YicC family protein [Acidobacteriota bacterium]|nr:YicC family protein [Acidobacteriota bacterium]
MSSVYSMTGFASSQVALEGQHAFTLAVKSVNHRFLDVHLRLPSGSDALEMEVRKLLKERLRRGHVEVTLQLERRSNTQLRLNTDLLAAYVAAHREAAQLHAIASEPDLNQLLRLPGMMSAEAGLSAAEAAALETTVVTQLGRLLEQLNEVRAQEGATLAAELSASMERLRGYADEVSTLRQGMREAQLERLRARMAELTQGVGISEERLLAEAAMLAEKSDVDEELVRLRTHVDRFVALLAEGGELGKRLDFLLQELNRETNTMLSKTSSGATGNGLRITELGLEMKSEIEKSREQVQNLE